MIQVYLFNIIIHQITSYTCTNCLLRWVIFSIEIKTKNPLFICALSMHMHIKVYSILTLVVVVFPVTIVAIGHGLLEEIFAYGNRLCATHCREFPYLKHKILKIHLNKQVEDEIWSCLYLPSIVCQNNSLYEFFFTMDIFVAVRAISRWSLRSTASLRS